MAFSDRRLAAGIGLAVAAILAGCAGAPAVPAVTPADASRAGTRWPGTGQPELESGRTLYLERCSSCHLPPAPSSAPADQWPTHVDEMKERAGLTEDQATLVERYLMTVASRDAAR